MIKMKSQIEDMIADEGKEGKLSGWVVLYTVERDQ